MPQCYVIGTLPITFIPFFICSVLSARLLSFFTSFLLPLRAGRTFSLRDRFCIWEHCITYDVEQDEYPSRLVCQACKPTSWLELWLFPARLFNSEYMTMTWRFCVFNLPRVNKTEPLYFYSLLLCPGITPLPLYSHVSCPFRLSHRWQMNLI